MRTRYRYRTRLPRRRKMSKIKIQIEGDVGFYFDILEIYNKNKKKLSKLRIKSERDVLDFCISHASSGTGIHNSVPGHPFLPSKAHLKYENLCKIVYVFLNVLGKPMPDHIHTRMILGSKNEYVEKYVQYHQNLKPFLFGIFNRNKNNFKLHYLSTCGHIGKLMLK